MKLEQYRDLAYRAYTNISFSPEKRAETIIKDYSEELEEDLKLLEEENGSTGNYEEKYINHFTHWLGAKSRCMSSMITGSANFPVARNEKFHRWEDSAYDKFREWRKRYIKKATTPPPLTAEEELDKAIKDYDESFALQEMMKEANKIIRKELKRNTDISKIKEMLVEVGLKESTIEEIMKNDAWYGYGFPRFALTNNNAKVKRTKEKIIIMKNRIERKTDFEKIEFEGGYIDIVADRVIISHDERPEQEIIDKLKANGFRWSRNYGNWSRKHTYNALETAKKIVK